MSTKDRDNLYEVARRLAAISTSTLHHHGMKGYEGRKVFELSSVKFKVSDEEGFCISYFGSNIHFGKHYAEDGQMRNENIFSPMAYHLTGKTLQDLYKSIEEQPELFRNAMKSILKQTLQDLNIKEQRKKFIDEWIAKLLAFFSSSKQEVKHVEAPVKKEPTPQERHQALHHTMQNAGDDAFLIEYTELYGSVIAKISTLAKTLQQSKLPHAPKYLHFINSQVYINVMENWKAYRKVAKVDRSKASFLQHSMMEQMDLITRKIGEIEEEVSDEYASHALESIEIQHQVLKQMASSL